jgi:DNA-binding Lrp family transcriptional regulator
LVALVRVRRHEELADLVAGRIQKVPGIEETNTLIAFQAYSRRSLEAMWDIGNEDAPKKQ